MCPDSIQMRSMWNEARMLASLRSILLNCCILCILYGGAASETVFKDAQAMCARLFHDVWWESLQCEIQLHPEAFASITSSLIVIFTNKMMSDSDLCSVTMAIVI